MGLGINYWSLIIQLQVASIVETHLEPNLSSKGCTRLSGKEHKPTSYLTRYMSDDAGQSATEYILIIGLVVVPMAIAFNELQEALRDLSNKLARLLFGPGV